jgi:hypothetical protein
MNRRKFMTLLGGAAACGARPAGRCPVAALIPLTLFAKHQEAQIK